MKSVNNLFLILIFVCFSACSKKSANSSDKDFDLITFGSGGGFTGMVKSYSLSKDGSLKAVQGNQELAKIPPKTIQQVVKKIKQSKALTTEFNQPGNFYYFIEIQKADKVNRITWSDKDKAPTEITSLYQYLTELTKPYLK